MILLPQIPANANLLSSGREPVRRSGQSDHAGMSDGFKNSLDDALHETHTGEHFGESDRRAVDEASSAIEHDSVDEQAIAVGEMAVEIDGENVSSELVANDRIIAQVSQFDTELVTLSAGDERETSTLSANLPGAFNAGTAAQSMMDEAQNLPGGATAIEAVDSDTRENFRHISPGIDGRIDGRLQVPSQSPVSSGQSAIESSSGVMDDGVSQSRSRASMVAETISHANHTEQSSVDRSANQSVITQRSVANQTSDSRSDSTQRDQSQQQQTSQPMVDPKSHSRSAVSRPDIVTMNTGSRSMPTASTAELQSADRLFTTDSTNTPATQRAAQVEAGILAARVEQHAKGTSGNSQTSQLQINATTVATISLPDAASQLLHSVTDLAATSSADQTSATTTAKDSIEAAFKNQLIKGMSAMLHHHGGSLTLRLDPPHLGSLKIQMAVHGSAVTASFQASNQQAHTMLRDSISTLTSMLESQGLSVEKIAISLSASADDSNSTGRFNDRATQHEERDQQQQRTDAGGSESRGRRDQANHQHDEQDASRNLTQQFTDFISQKTSFSDNETQL